MPEKRPRRAKKTEESASSLAAELERLGAPRTGLALADVAAMKPETRDEPFDDPRWIFELKYDGFRLLAARAADATVELSYRSGRDARRYFPDVARAVAALPATSLILDGEVVALDATGRPRFQRLQRRGVHTRSAEAARAAAEMPATYFVFDLLALDGYDLRPLPLRTRKSLLRRLLPPEGPIRYVDHVPERGEDFYAAVTKMGLEGIVAKREDSPYRAGYSSDWLKIRVDQVADFAVVGFTPVPGSRSRFRRLHLAACEGAGFVYAGKVGTGFSGEEYEEIRARLESARRVQPRWSGRVPDGEEPVWVEPEIVVEVRYKEWTEGGHLRLPVFLRLRDDKTVYECFRPGAEPEGEPAAAAPEEPPSAPPPSQPAMEPAPAPRFTNLDKVFWPEEGYTKGDLVEYYRSVAPWLLPYLGDRPLVLDRYPDGIAGKSFFQKSATDQVRSRLRTVPIDSGGFGKKIDYFLCDDEASLLHLVNLGTIPLHVWSSRLGSLDRPDWCILDLDPKGAPFGDVVRIATEIRALSQEIELPSFIKTSGGSGLHVLLPMGAQLEHEQVRQLAEVLAQVIVGRLPEIATTVRSIPKRRGKVYVDALQNGRGKLLAAPLSVRPLPGAPVSTPLPWDEVGPRLDVRKFTIRTVPKRLKKMQEDPLRPILETRPDLARTLELLVGRM